MQPEGALPVLFQRLAPLRAG